MLGWELTERGECGVLDTGRFAGACSGIRKHHDTTVYTQGGGTQSVTLRDCAGGGDMKDEETVKCEHGMDVFEVSPPAPPTPPLTPP